MSVLAELLPTLLVLAVLPLLMPALALLVLTLSAAGRCSANAPCNADAGPAPRVAVMVPAHDESAHLLPTLRNLQAQLSPRDRLLVVADNCSDDTATVARTAGAEVVERHDPLRRGKGYALAHGVAALRDDPPDVVLVVDADCQLTPGSLADIARACWDGGRPVQMLNLMSAPAGAGLRLRMAEFAMVMKNQVRPMGTQRLGGVCHLMGTGMALPWALMVHAPLATGHVAEDMLMGIALTRGGHPPAFLPTARVASRFVDDAGTLHRQKARWEHGHLDTLRHELPALLRAALRTRSRALAVLALDLCIPPVALYFSVLMALGALAAAAAWTVPAARPAAAVVGLCVGAFAVAVCLAWWCFARPLLRPLELLRAPLYALWKLPIYAAYALGARSGWVRTPRKPHAMTSSGLRR